MADDDNADWFTQDDEPAAEAEAAPAAAAATGGGGGEAAAGGEEAAAGGAPAEEKVEEVEHEEYLDPDKLLLFRHWIRPKFLQYKYLYDYRQNYYNDVIDYLDKRAHGIKREIPHAQTWAERTVRTLKSSQNAEEFRRKLKEDRSLVERSRSSGQLFRICCKDSINRRYSKLLY
ncbi:flightin isoform X2 [Aethina tumida]|uniref:flightin isoform X2 n=1 Tax=Aethina tumida TaxID=116153 RepID=UPI002149608D|nr:flightin isoform X2 [Aethina tumida]